MEDSSGIDTFYYKNSRLPDNVHRPYVPPNAKKPAPIVGIQGLFDATQFLSYANESDKALRGAPSIPGPQAMQYAMFPKSRPENQSAECACAKNKVEKAEAAPQPLGASIGEFSAYR